MANHNPLVAFILYILFILATVVIAGHPFWEQHATPFSLNYVRMAPSEFQQVWPNTRVPYCYTNHRVREYLDLYIKFAMGAWYAAGLPSHFVMEEISREECLRHRKTSLEIGMSANAGWYSSTGMSTALGEAGPIMMLGMTRPDLFAFNLPSVIHEIGHVWGLFHEHQDPTLWRGDYSPFEFHCPNLAQFAEKTAGLSYEQIWGQDGICVNQWSAANSHFTAINFLPLPWANTISPREDLAGADQVDWKSVMLYESSSFAVDEGRTGLFSYTRKAGPPYIEKNNVPSTWDVLGIKRMYGSRDSQPQPILYNEPRSPFYSLFAKLLPECHRR
ncbi:hypothetical protein BDV59DRAFT_204169 [Aspergillus ambiguus]|uniref:uncharacterized protein n=1 Tax=Aspergillus ambiguus TaxID=176160 RepID=UPI003CCDC27F